MLEIRSKEIEKGRKIVYVGLSYDSGMQCSTYISLASSSSRDLTKFEVLNPTTSTLIVYMNRRAFPVDCVFDTDKCNNYIRLYALKYSILHNSKLSSS